MRILVWLIFSILSSICYHVAGIGGFKGAKLIRRLGCSLLALWLFLALKTPQIRHIWLYLAFLGLNYGTLSSYWSELRDPRDDVSAIEWFVTGLIYGLAAIPLLWCGVAFWAIIGRAIFLAISIWWLRVRTGKNWLEEIGSGLLYCGSIPLLLLN